MALFLFARRREPSGKVLLGVLAVVAVASLGPHLHIANPPQPTNGTFVYRPSIPLPWLPFTHLPLFKEVAPGRLAMYVSLIAAVVVAMWLAAPGRRRLARWLLAAAAVVFLVPNISARYWHARLDDPPFFTNGGTGTTCPLGNERSFSLSVTTGTACCGRPRLACSSR